MEYKFRGYFPLSDKDIEILKKDLKGRMLTLRSNRFADKYLPGMYKLLDGSIARIDKVSENALTVIQARVILRSHGIIKTNNGFARICGYVDHDDAIKNATYKQERLFWDYKRMLHLYSIHVVNKK